MTEYKIKLRKHAQSGLITYNLELTSPPQSKIAFYVLTPDDSSFFESYEDAEVYANSWLDVYRDPNEWGVDEHEVVIMKTIATNVATDFRVVGDETSHDYKMIRLNA